MPVLPGAEPFSTDGDDVGVVLCHGFTGSPQSLRPWAERLAAEGFTVRLPRLPGHGTTWREMNRTEWPDWYAAVEAATVELAQRCRVVVAAGLSMGGALALRLAQQHPTQVHGLVVVNTAVRLTPPGPFSGPWDLRALLALLPLLRRVAPTVRAVGGDIKKPGVHELAYDRTPLHALASSLDLYRHVVRDLPAVRQPLLLARSLEDHVVPAASSELVLARVSSTDVTDLVLRDSYHVATLDHDAAALFDASVEFVRRVAASVPSPTTTATTTTATTAAGNRPAPGAAA